MPNPLIIVHETSSYNPSLLETSGNLQTFPDHPLPEASLKEIIDIDVEDNQVSDKISRTYRAKYDFSMRQKELVELFLDVTYQHSEGGIPGWVKEFGEFGILLESSPTTAAALGRMNCVSRQLLLYGMVMQTNAFSELAMAFAFTYKHSFLIFEDALGFARVIEPSGYRSHSYYLDKLPLHTITEARQSGIPYIILKNCYVGSRREQVYIHCGAKISSIGLSLNFAHFLDPDPVNFVEVLGFLLEKHPLNETVRFNYSVGLLKLGKSDDAWVHLLVSAYLNQFYPDPIICIAKFPIEKTAFANNKRSVLFLPGILDIIVDRINQEETFTQLRNRMIDDMAFRPSDSERYINQAIINLNKARKA